MELSQSFQTAITHLIAEKPDVFQNSADPRQDAGVFISLNLPDFLDETNPADQLFRQLAAADFQPINH